MKKLFVCANYQTNLVVYISQMLNKRQFDFMFPDESAMYQHMAGKGIDTENCSILVIDDNNLVNMIKNYALILDWDGNNNLINVTPPIAYAFGHKTDGNIKGYSGRFHTGVPLEESLKGDLVDNHGSTVNDYSIYYIYNDSEYDRFKNQESYYFQWDNSPEIIGIDWSPEENKGWIEFTADKTIVSESNGNDRIDMEAYVYESDGTTVDTTFNDKIFIPIQTPTRSTKLWAQFNNGVMTRNNFRPKEVGSYYYPNAKYVDDLRVKSVLHIQLVPEV